MDVDAKALGGILELCYAESDSLRYRHCSPHYIASMMVAARALSMKRVLESLESDAYPDASWDEPLLDYLLAANMRFTEVAKDLESDLPCDIFPSGYLPEMVIHSRPLLPPFACQRSPKGGSTEIRSSCQNVLTNA